MAIVKALRFPTRARWLEGRRLELSAPGKPSLGISTPPEFKDGVPGIWSPEELMVGAVAACYELTFVAIAEKLGVPVGELTVDALGHVERGLGGYGFTVLELDVAVETEPAHEAQARKAAALAEEHCIVGRALEVPVHVRVAVTPRRVEMAVAAP